MLRMESSVRLELSTYETCGTRNSYVSSFFRRSTTDSAKHDAGRERECSRVSFNWVAVNKAVVIRLPKKATKVAVSQPKIAEVEMVSPDTLLIHGRAVGATSLVVWFEEP